MKLVYKGIFKQEDQLPIGTLPAQAVKMDEAESLDELNQLMLKAALPVGVLLAAGIGLSYWLHGRLNAAVELGPLLLSLVFGFVALFIHEFFHALCFGKNSEVELFISPSKGMLFVVCTKALPKLQFIFMCLCPSLVLGWIPFIIWILLPFQGAFSTLLLVFSLMQVLVSLGDYINAYNALRQMPKGSYQQLSGLHSYWFIPASHKRP